MNGTKRNGKTGIRHSRQDDGRPTAFSCSLKPEAVEVYLAGDFNGWDPQAERMPGNGNGTFEKTVALAPGEHQYKFVIDGEWYSDPLATRQVPNEFGSVNSVRHSRLNALAASGMSGRRTGSTLSGGVR